MRTKAALIILVSSLLLLSSHSATLAQTTIPPSVDVVVAGAGTGGIGAAIQAARSGAKVLLLEETDWVGGQMTAAAVTPLDIHNIKLWGSGIFKEYYDKMFAFYQLKSGEPHKDQQFLRSMIAAEPNITLVLLTKITSVQKSGSKVTGVTLSGGHAVATKVLIDATEYGDILPLAGANYRLGNTNSTDPNPNSCIQDITYNAVIKKYPNGVPAELKITSPPPGYSDQVRQMFAAITTKDSTNGWLIYPVSWETHNQYRAMLYNSDRSEVIKTGVNWANDWPTPLTLKINYLTDLNYRFQANCDAKLRTIQFIYYAQHDMGKTDWAVSTDENYDLTYNTNFNSCPNIPAELKTIEKNLPVIPYVRESRRMIGLYTLVAADAVRSGTPLQAQKKFSSSIAVGDYPYDLHNCNASGTLEPLDDPAFLTSPGGPFQVPLETLISDNITGLIAAEKNISVSRAVNGAIRLQPITMLTGQAAGALSALAAKLNIAPREVPVIKVQQELLKGKSILYPFADVTTSDPYFAAIQEAGVRGFMSYTNELNFSPLTDITRDQAAVVLSRVFSIPLSRPDTPTFSDVPKDHWAYPYIEGLYKSGITAGCSTTPRNFCPQSPVTNAELAVFTFKSWQLLNPNLPVASPTTPTFADVPKTHFASASVEALNGLGAVWRCSTGFCPTAVVKRQNMADIMVRIANNAMFVNNPQYRIGDINRDNRVNILDIGILIDNYDRNPLPNPMADLTGDGRVNILDIGVAIDHYDR